MPYILVALGLAGLFAGGHWLVTGASAMALRLGMAPLVVGLTVVAFGTSTPELLVSLDAALRGASGIAIGNVVGSNISNLLGSLPVFAGGLVGRAEGALLVGGIALYLWLCLRAPGPVETPEVAPAPLWRSVATILLGLVALVAGARFLVDGASEIARTLGVSEAAIGLTVVAVGTSLPELATSVIAAMRGQRELALGNVVGSNTFNVFAILGLTAMISPIPVEPRFLSVDVPVMIAVSLALVAAIWLAGGLGRRIGAVSLAAYAAYVATTALI